MKALFFALLVLLVTGTVRAVETVSLDAVVESPDLWTLPKDQFMERGKPLGFRWVSEAQDGAQIMRPGVTLFDLPTNQTIARFEDGSPKEMTVLFYNRGDAGDLSQEKFTELYKGVSARLSAHTGAAGAELGRDAVSAVKAHQIQWKTEATIFTLEYSVTREVKTRGIPFRAEFVRLVLAPVPEERSLVAAALAEHDAAKVSLDPKSHVKREASGDVWIEGIPMVDQGQKGYCVVASAERVLRYFGRDVDQHELAQVANSSSSGGTNVSAMVDALKSLTQRLKIRVRAIEELDVKAILDLVKDYNRETKRGKLAPEIETGKMLDVSAIYGAMKPELLKATRTKSKSGPSRFFRTVQTRVDEGTPLLWSVQLGIVPEPEIPQAAGGHMRLIHGYNAKTNEILYTDSWGPGHEMKRMALDDAWTITTALGSIEQI